MFFPNLLRLYCNGDMLTHPPPGHHVDGLGRMRVSVCTRGRLYRRSLPDTGHLRSNAQRLSRRSVYASCPCIVVQGKRAQVWRHYRLHTPPSTSVRAAGRPAARTISRATQGFPKQGSVRLIQVWPVSRKSGNLGRRVCVTPGLSLPGGCCYEVGVAPPGLEPGSLGQAQRSFLPRQRLPRLYP